MSGECGPDVSNVDTARGSDTEMWMSGELLTLLKYTSLHSSNFGAPFSCVVVYAPELTYTRTIKEKIQKNTLKYT